MSNMERPISKEAFGRMTNRNRIVLISTDPRSSADFDIGSSLMDIGDPFSGSRKNIQCPARNIQCLGKDSEYALNILINN